MENLVKIFSIVNKYVCCIILLLMVGLVFSNTFLRYFFNSGIIITEEFVRYLFMWAVFLGVISVWFTRGHIRVTTVTDRLSNRNKIIFSIVFEIFSIAILLTLGIGSVEYFFDTTTVGQVTDIPYKVMILAMIVGAFFCTIISIKHILNDAKLLKLSDEELQNLAKEQEGK